MDGITGMEFQRGWAEKGPTTYELRQGWLKAAKLLRKANEKKSSTHYSKPGATDMLENGPNKRQRDVH